MTIADLDTVLDLLGWRLGAGPRAHASLSPREQQILGLVVGGRTQKEAAFELGVSDATVRVLYSRAMKKLGRSKHRRSERSVRR
jgi:DNA-binding NarL/FixJ family response regulator